MFGTDTVQKLRKKTEGAHKEIQALKERLEKTVETSEEIVSDINTTINELNAIKKETLEVSKFAKTMLGKK